MILGAIEISTRLTRLSVIDIDGNNSATLLERSHAVSAELANLERLSALLMAEVERARDLGADRVEVIASSDLRGTRLIRLLDRVSQGVGAGEVRLPGPREAVGAAFLAATRPLDLPVEKAVAVAIVSDSMIGIGVGAAGSAPAWIGARPVGAVAISEKAGFSDPPRPNQIEAAITGTCRRVGSLGPPPFSRMLVVSGFANVVKRLCGSAMTFPDARRGLESILGQTADDLAAWFGIDPASSRFLPGAMVGHAAIAGSFGSPVEPVKHDLAAGLYWLDEAAVVSGQSHP